MSYSEIKILTNINNDKLFENHMGTYEGNKMGPKGWGILLN